MTTVDNYDKADVYMRTVPGTQTRQGKLEGRQMKYR